MKINAEPAKVNWNKNCNCIHDHCKECKGTGTRKDGTPCHHFISCKCMKCNPYYHEVKKKKMIAIIKSNGELVTFKMVDANAERQYAKDFLNVPENARLNLGKLGRIWKSDILCLKRVINVEEAEAFHKGTLTLLYNIVNKQFRKDK